MRRRMNRMVEAKRGDSCSCTHLWQQQKLCWIWGDTPGKWCPFLSEKTTQQFDSCLQHAAVSKKRHRRLNPMRIWWMGRVLQKPRNWSQRSHIRARSASVLEKRKYWHKRNANNSSSGSLDSERNWKEKEVGFFLFFLVPYTHGVSIGTSVCLPELYFGLLFCQEISSSLCTQSLMPLPPTSAWMSLGTRIPYPDKQTIRSTISALFKPKIVMILAKDQHSVWGFCYVFACSLSFTDSCVMCVCRVES